MIDLAQDGVATLLVRLAEIIPDRQPCVCDRLHQIRHHLHHVHQARLRTLGLADHLVADEVGEGDALLGGALQGGSELLRLCGVAALDQVNSQRRDQPVELGLRIRVELDAAHIEVGILAPDGGQDHCILLCRRPFLLQDGHSIGEGWRIGRKRGGWSLLKVGHAEQRDCGQ